MGFWKPFIIGFIIAIILMIFIVGFLYYLKIYPFHNCSTTNYCTESDYYNDPSEDPNPYIFEENGKIYYKRSVKNLRCVPKSSDMLIEIKNPDKCIFKTINNTNIIAENKSFNSPLYKTNYNNKDIFILTSGNCNPIKSTDNIVVSGKIKYN